MNSRYVTAGCWGKYLNRRDKSYYSPNIIRMIKEDKWAWCVVGMGEKKNAYSVLVGKPEGRRKLRRPTIRRKDNIKMVKVKLSLCLTN
jgi:hypothetical protein